VLSLTQLRKLHFPGGNASKSAERDIAGRAVIAALGLLAVTLHQEDGYQLRSRCQLVPSKTPYFEVIGRTENERDTFELDSAAAEAALRGTLEAAGNAGLTWHAGRIDLQPRPDLVKLVAYSDGTTGGGAEGE
jgi:CRISPR-associated protein Csb1